MKLDFRRQKFGYEIYGTAFKTIILKRKNIFEANLKSRDLNRRPPCCLLRAPLTQLRCIHHDQLYTSEYLSANCRSTSELRVKKSEFNARKVNSPPKHWWGQRASASHASGRKTSRPISGRNPCPYLGDWCSCSPLSRPDDIFLLVTPDSKWQGIGPL